MGRRKNFPSFQKRGEKTWFKDRQCPASPGKEILGLFFPLFNQQVLCLQERALFLCSLLLQRTVLPAFGVSFGVSLAASSKSHLAQRRWKSPNSWEQRGFTEAWLEQVLSVAEILDFPWCVWTTASKNNVVLNRFGWERLWWEVGGEEDRANRISECLRDPIPSSVVWPGWISKKKPVNSSILSELHGKSAFLFWHLHAET